MKTKKGVLKAEIGRRSFLAALGLLALEGKASSVSAGKSSRKILIAARDHHLKAKGVRDTWEAAKSIGLEGIEAWMDINRNCSYLLLSGSPVTLKDKSSLQALSERCRASGIKITAFCLPNRFDRRPKEELTWLIDTIEYAAELEIPAVRIDVVPGKNWGDEKEFLKLAAGIIKKALKATSGLPVRLGVENHGRVTNRPEFLSALFEEVGSMRFGLTLDTGNFYWYGFPLNELYKIYERFARRVFHTHIKSINYPHDKENTRRPIGWQYGKWCAPIYEGDIDFRRVYRILKKAGYSNDLCIEDEALGKFPEEDRMGVLRKEVEFLRRIREAEA